MNAIMSAQAGFSKGSTNLPVNKEQTMKKFLTAVLSLTTILLMASMALAAGHTPVSDKAATSVLDFTLNLADGTPTPLNNYAGKVLVLVNVASRCGYTGQYAGLQRIFKKYEEQGFAVLGFPANDFMGQEPGTNEEIVSFCSLNYGVTFPIFAKISVKGRNKHELYRYLTDEKNNPGFAEDISWNFNKFIVDRKGKVIARFGSMTGPENAELLATIEKALQEKPLQEKP